MQAIVRERVRLTRRAELVEIERPELTDDGVLVRVQAASLNRIDWYHLTGTPLVGRAEMGLRKPKSRQFRADFAGTVEAVGKDVTDFGPGDEVFGGGSGRSPSTSAPRRAAVAHKPAESRSRRRRRCPIAGAHRAPGLRDHAQVQPGQKV